MDRRRVWVVWTPHVIAHPTHCALIRDAACPFNIPSLTPAVSPVRAILVAGPDLRRVGWSALQPIGAVDGRGSDGALKAATETTTPGQSSSSTIAFGTPASTSRSTRSSAASVRTKATRRWCTLQGPSWRQRGRELLPAPHVLASGPAQMTVELSSGDQVGDGPQLRGDGFAQVSSLPQVAQSLDDVGWGHDPPQSHCRSQQFR